MSDDETDSVERQVKVALVGSPGVGKTAIVIRYTQDTFSKVFQVSRILYPTCSKYAGYLLQGFPGIHDTLSKVFQVRRIPSPRCSRCAGYLLQRVNATHDTLSNEFDVLRIPHSKYCVPTNTNVFLVPRIPTLRCSHRQDTVTKVFVVRRIPSARCSNKS